MTGPDGPASNVPPIAGGDNTLATAGDWFEPSVKVAVGVPLIVLPVATVGVELAKVMVNVSLVFVVVPQVADVISPEPPKLFALRVKMVSKSTPERLGALVPSE